MKNKISKVALYTTSKSGEKLTKTVLPLIKKEPLSGVIIEIKGTKKQKFFGFGTSLTESSAAVYNTLSEEKKMEALNAIYKPHPEGANYVFNRTHIGSCDFSSGDYYYAEKEDLSDFSLESDKSVKTSKDKDELWNAVVKPGGPGIIHYMKLADRISGGKLQTIASPWSPPAWMRDNNRLYGDGVLSKDKYKVYADYFVKYINACKKEGINIWALTPQNECMAWGDHWETHRMYPEESAEFVGSYLGPALEAAGLGGILIFGYDHNKGDGMLMKFAKAAYENDKFEKYHHGMAHHWYKNAVDFFPEELDETFNLNTNKLLIATEQSIDSFNYDNAYMDAWKNDQWWWENKAPDWTHGPNASAVGRYVKAVITDLNHHTSAWISWNAALFKNGGPNHRGNACTADVMVDNGEIYYTPTFYAMQHFTRFIRPGSNILESTGADNLGLWKLAAVNEDNSVVLVLYNEADEMKTCTVKFGDSEVEIKIPACSIQTVEFN